MNKVTVRVVAGDWCRSSIDNVHAVVDSAVATFQDVLDGRDIIKIALEPSAETYPWTKEKENDRGEFVVYLKCQEYEGWDQMAYQFSHEFCHVLADPTTSASVQKDGFFWIEEVLCETASIFALKSMASKWMQTPLGPVNPGYWENLLAYAQGRIDIGCGVLPKGADISAWLAGRLPDLSDPENNYKLREDQTAVAVRLFPIFENEPSAWAVVFHLHAFRRDRNSGLADFMKSWSQACPTGCSRFILQIAKAMGIGDGQ